MRSFFSNNDDVVSGPRELLRAGQPCRAGAYDRDALAGLALGRLRRDASPVSQPLSMMACSIDLMPTGSLLMLSVQASSQGAGQMRPVNSGKLLVECSVSSACFQFCCVDQVVPVRNDVVDRAAAHAERNAAVHAARALDLGLVVVQVMDELAPVLDALFLRLARLGQPLVLQKSRYLAHRQLDLEIMLVTLKALSCQLAALAASSPSARLYSFGNTLTNFGR